MKKLRLAAQKLKEQNPRAKLPGAETQTHERNTNRKGITKGNLSKTGGLRTNNAGRNRRVLNSAGFFAHNT